MKEQIKTIPALRDQVQLVVASAVIPDNELVKTIQESIKCLRQVGSQNAITIANIIETQFNAARKQRYSIDRIDSLKALAIWGGRIQLGWI